ncbi:MAG: PQQ-binding-like beta-propeller repeat protein [Candidatus Bathyarchaeia archaeon]|jgi:hypothetical protein
MEISKNKFLSLLISAILLLSIAGAVSPMILAQITPPAGSSIPSYAHLNVGPNPAGIGQIVTLNMYLVLPLLTSQGATPFTIKEVTPSGTTTTLGPFTSDATGGTYTTITPDQLGNYTFQFFYGGQNMTDGVYNLPSQSDIVTLVVQQEPVSRSSYPVTPLPTSWWENPISAENVQNWYAINGPWMGYGFGPTFAATGGYNSTGNYNPYTLSVNSGHILWTKPWCEGGVVGGADNGGNEQGSSYWSTSQYWPKYAPVIIDGIMYSTHYVETTGYTNGILATNLFTGADLWTINTTNALRCGYAPQWKTINAYGTVGPYIWTTGTLPAADTGGRQIGSQSNAIGGTTPSPYMNTTGTQWNMYSGLTGKYILSIVNGTSATLTTDSNANIIGYYINSTVGTLTTYGNAPAMGSVPVTGHATIVANNPDLVCWNMSQLMANTWGWAPAVNTIINWEQGIMWAQPIQNNTGPGTPTIGVGTNNPAFAINGITNNAVMMTTGFATGQGAGGDVDGFLLVASMDATTGAQLWVKNFTYPTDQTLLPFTRTQLNIQDGVFINVNMANWAVVAYDARTGALKWTYTLKGFNGAAPEAYDQFNIKTYNGPNDSIYIEGFGGDIWSINDQTGHLNWYTNTTMLIGSPGIETPYNLWPLWTFSCCCMTNDTAYFMIGHEYDPPLFHGAQLLAVNASTGTLNWSILDMSIESTSITEGVMLSRNAYDNQIYAFARGPSSTTVTAPSIGVTTATPITITGTVMDVSAGASQDAVARNFPNGLPCVSDASQSHWMEYVYEQQQFPTGATGVPVTLSVIDANNNFRTIGTTTSDTSGTYAFTWTPDIPGNYTVIASFAGSNSYYGSTAEAHMYASLPPATAAPATTPVAGLATSNDVMYIGVAIIVVIIIIGAVLAVLMMRKK